MLRRNVVSGIKVGHFFGGYGEGWGARRKSAQSTTLIGESLKRTRPEKAPCRSSSSCPRSHRRRRGPGGIWQFRRLDPRHVCQQSLRQGVGIGRKRAALNLSSICSARDSMLALPLRLKRRTNHPIFSRHHHHLLWATMTESAVGFCSLSCRCEDPSALTTLQIDYRTN